MMLTTTQNSSLKTASLVSTSSLPLHFTQSPLTAINENLADVPLPPSRPPVSNVLDKDRETPDSHVTRDSRLIRLTGVHPFNAEAPLTKLYQEGNMALIIARYCFAPEVRDAHTNECIVLGFITSVDLFYVRNHGPVPHVYDDEVWSWELSIEG